MQQHNQHRKQPILILLFTKTGTNELDNSLEPPYKYLSPEVKSRYDPKAHLAYKTSLTKQLLISFLNIELW